MIEFTKGQKITVTRGNWKGVTGEITAHTPGSSYYGVTLVNGANASYKITALKSI
jgi:hypothetical protein